MTVTLKPELFTLFAILFIFIGLFFYFWIKGRSEKKEIHTPTLFQYSKDLTQLATEGKLDPVINRKEEIERVTQVLSMRTKNNPVLVGKAGVGKTAIVEGLAQRIISKKVPKVLQSKKVLALDLSGIVAGTKYRGEFERRLKAIADEITKSKRKIILFIDEVHSLAEAGKAEGAIDASDILKPALARGELQLVGATTKQDYERTIKKDPTLDRRLHPIFVDEPTKKETIEILEGIKSRYENYHKVVIPSEIIKAAVELVDKVVPKESYPDKAIELIDEAAAKVRLEKLANGKEPPPKVTIEDIKEVLDDWKKDLG